MASVRDLLAQSRTLAGEEALREAQLLLCAALDKPRSYLIAWPEADVPAAAERRYRDWLQKRVQGVPIAYLLGARDFWSLSLQVNEATLIPRADTELLVETALSLDLSGDAAVLDLGTGSGAIALALAKERPFWRITAVEQSIEAFEVARANGEHLGLQRIEWLLGDWYSKLSGRRFSLIVSNPPYIAEGDPHLINGDLRFEPRSALASGVDGLDDIREIIDSAPMHLEPGGQLFLEHGFAQGTPVRALLTAAGFLNVGSSRDLAGHERVSGGAWKGELAE
ncbi:peptide chain release factor N(5)-glutamine methyltransferase [Congregibacter brevis]|uniref:Release factor glutamine methyltransferase n=1 Tax=Congregibacter brevis TaxID=3081201 RepID=A0ABZ0IGZ2_9GAMM|nr:peptide chain release factor N(5)-glutamine methyltransferase [Congregibacter sp. IMCC45268]